MKAHTNEYKNALIGVREINRILRTYNTEWANYNSDNLVSVKPILNTPLFKTSMKELDIEAKTKIEKETLVDYKNGLKVNDNYEYINYGEYYVYEVEYRPDTKTYFHICYDKMLYTMIPYETLSVTYPITVKNYIVAIAQKCGLEFTANNFANHDKMITKDYFTEGNYTYRDILDYLCELIGGWLYIDENERLNVKYPTETNEVFNEDYLNCINVTFEKKYGPVNSVVFARANELDNIEYKDDESISQNGLCQVKFSDNPLLSDENRSDFLNQVALKIIGLEFYLNDLESKGITYLELGDIYSFKISEEMQEALKTGLVKAGMRKAQGTNKTKYKCLMLNDETEIKKGITEKIFTDEPEEDNSDYITTIPSNNSLKNAEIIVNKNAGEIVLKANSDGKVVQARLDADADDGSLFEIQADNIDLAGYVTISDLAGTGTTTIDGSNVTTGTIKSQNYVSGTSGTSINLTNGSIDTKNFKLDSSGNMTASSGTFNGTLNTSENCTIGNNLYAGQNQATTTYDEKYIYFTNKAYIKRIKQGNNDVIGLHGDISRLVAGNNKIQLLDGGGINLDTDKSHLSFGTNSTYLDFTNNNTTSMVWVDGNYARLYSGTTGGNSNYFHVKPNSINASTQITIDSDKRLKKNIEDVNVNWIDELKIKEFEYKDKDIKQIGLIAQDYIDKDYSKYFLNENENGYYSIAYGNITNALIQYCQEIKKEINSLKEEIKNIKESDK